MEETKNSYQVTQEFTAEFYALLAKYGALLSIQNDSLHCAIPSKHDNDGNETAQKAEVIYGNWCFPQQEHFEAILQKL